MPKIMAQYPETESIGSIGSVILGILEVQVPRIFTGCVFHGVESLKAWGVSLCGSSERLHVQF